MLKKFHPYIYFTGLALLVTSLPLSIFVLSLAQIILALNWILENNFREKLALALQRKSIFAFVVIYLIHIAGMFYSSDWNYGLHDLKIKLPLLILPVIIGTTRPLPPKQFKYILILFCLAVFTSTIISTGKLFGWWGAPVMDVRDISIFISHIRLALMVNIAVFILIWFICNQSNLWEKVSFSLLAVWLVFFLIILKSLTGVVILLVVSIFFLIRWMLKSENLMVRWFVTVGIAFVVLFASTYFSHSAGRFKYVERPDYTLLEKYTPGGNFYVHDTLSGDFENGNYTWLYVCDKELEMLWNKRSSLSYKGTDLKGQELRFTLIRYLTSKGMRKDSAGMASLTLADIRNIEMGMANHIFSRKLSFYPRIYQLLWEINQWKNGGNPSGHSFTQRIEYLSTAFRIIKSNLWFGVGTGDVAIEFDQQYNRDNSKLDPRWQLRAHNQLVTFLLTFGITGFVIIVFSLLYPVIAARNRSYFLLLFIFIGFLSFLNEDTLETHAGISFFAFFYAFFLYNSMPNDEENNPSR
jgi:hypothetical protein